MLPVPMLERLGNSNARMRVFGNLNRIIAGILVTQVRAKGDTSCGAGVQTFPHKFPNLMPTCTIREGKRVVDTLPFGVDPMFVSQASIYSHSVAVNAEEYYGKAQEHADLTFNEQGIPWGFQNGENGYPIFFDINLEESRAALMMNYMKEGNYLSSISGSNASSTDQVDVRFVVYNGNYKVRDVCVCVCGVDGGTLLFSISPSTTLTSLLFLSSPLPPLSIQVFCMSSITFKFDQGGRIAVTLEVTSFDTELFAEPLDYFRLVLEIIFVGLLVLQLINEVYEMLTLDRKSVV
jgi:hypothetical protein